MTHKVTIYTTRTCPFCKMTKDFLNKNKISFEDKDVTFSVELQQEMIDKSGQMAVPVIEIDGEIVVGFNKAKIAELLNINS